MSIDIATGLVRYRLLEQLELPDSIVSAENCINPWRGEEVEKVAPSSAE